MMPSMPRLSTPARSENISPSVAKASGVAMRMMAARKPTWKICSNTALMGGPDAADAIGGEQQRHQHGKQRGALDDVAEEGRHAGRARHRLGAGHHGGEEDRRRHDAERIEPRQHGDDDAGIAVARRDVAHHLEMHAADLADAGEPGQRAGQQRGRDQHALDVDAAIARRLPRFSPVTLIVKPSVVRAIRNQINGAAISATSTPRCSRVPSISTGKFGRILDRRRDRIAAETDPSTALRSAPSARSR